MKQNSPNASRHFFGEKPVSWSGVPWMGRGILFSPNVACIEGNVFQSFANLHQEIIILLSTQRTTVNIDDLTFGNVDIPVTQFT